MPRKIHIAVLDDDEAMSSLLHDFLTRQGYEVSKLESVDAALKIVSGANGTKVPDLFLSDVKMSPLDGLQLTTQMLNKIPELPVILFSVYESKELQAKARKAGARRLLKKPFPLFDLVVVVREELEKSLRNKP